MSIFLLSPCTEVHNAEVQDEVSEFDGYRFSFTFLFSRWRQSASRRCTRKTIPDRALVRAAAGSFYSTLNPNEQSFFNQAQLRFQEIDSVSGGIAGETGVWTRANLQRQ